MLGKAKRKNVSSNFKPVTYAGDIVHSDVCGKLPRSIHGNAYFCTFLDQYAPYTHVTGIRMKSDVRQVFED